MAVALVHVAAVAYAMIYWNGRMRLVSEGFPAFRASAPACYARPDIQHSMTRRFADARYHARPVQEPSRQGRRACRDPYSRCWPRRCAYESTSYHHMRHRLTYI